MSVLKSQRKESGIKFLDTCISIHQRDGPTLEYHGYTSAVSIQKNPSNQQTMLVLREG